MVPKWPECGQNGCTAVPAPDARRCWAHVPSQGLTDALNKITVGVDLDLRGTEVTGDLLGKILGKVHDPAGLPTIGSLFCEEARFTDVTMLDKVVFSGNANFTRCAFDAGASFAAAVFGGSADFTGSAFAGTAMFTNAAFLRSVSFRECQFDSVAFNGAVFGGEASFAGAQVAAGLMLGPVSASDTLILTELRAYGDAEVRADVPRVRCESARFGGRTRLQLAGAELWLTDTVFAQSTIIESWHHPAQGQTPAPAADRPVRLRSLRGVDAEHLTLSDADLSQCLIYGIYRPEELRLAGRCMFAPTPRGWHGWYRRWKYVPWRWTRREALYEELLWRRESPTSALGWPIVVPGEGGAPSAAWLAVLYRQLRKSVEEARNEPGAADLYYGEMEMRRLSTMGRDERWLLTAYWLVSGYGLRASRSMLVLTCLILAAAEAFERAGFGAHHGHAPGYVDCLLYAAGSVLSLNLSGHLPAVLSDWGQVLRMILRIAGPVLLGLGALAIRGRVKR
jgi:uncharacterized protein YjbI with pentapeptide repeats